jgi:hypothetical protein
MRETVSAISGEMAGQIEKLILRCRRKLSQMNLTYSLNPLFEWPDTPGAISPSPVRLAHLFQSWAELNFYLVPSWYPGKW